MKNVFVWTCLALLVGLNSAFAPVAFSPATLKDNKVRASSRIFSEPESDKEGEGGSMFEPKQFKTEDTQWVDDRASANYGPGAKVSPWAVGLVVYPVVLLLNDFFHFLPNSN